MKYEVYEGIAVQENFDRFDFISFGKNGPVGKRVSFSSTDVDNVYNLAFGDVDERGELNDISVSNNGDRNKVLATVVNIVISYTNRFPERWILFQGSTESRTRLYRMAIGLNLEELSVKFDIYGFVGNELVTFAKNLNVNMFLIMKRKE
jgi:hypothetical protein